MEILWQNPKLLPNLALSPSSQSFSQAATRLSPMLNLTLFVKQDVSIARRLKFLHTMIKAEALPPTSMGAGLGSQAESHEGVNRMIQEKHAWSLIW